MTFEEFAPVFASLAVQLRCVDAEATTARVYFPVLQDLEFAFVAQAAQRLATNAEYFPKTSEWRSMVGRIEAERREAQRVLLRKLPTPLCPECDDSGWVADTMPTKPMKWLRPGPDGKPVFYERPPNAAPRRRCACQALRHAELIGARPWPSVPAALPTRSDGALTPEQSRITLTRLGRRGLRAAIKTMPAVPKMDEP